METSAETAVVNAAVKIPPLVARLLERSDAFEISLEAFDEVLKKTPGLLLLFFTEDPMRYRETLDLAVIAPELLADSAEPMRLGVLLPEAARALQPRYGFGRWPAFVLLRDGRYVGAIDGMRPWEEYQQEMARLQQTTPGRAPTVGVTVRSADGDDHCH
ncbi:MAG: hydrogenase [Proteobacteria bacterium]|nr:hydrogenase [Pseudomonadota bacterium]MCL2307928.1 hydrogenase [Pseudomonadota bacterium]